MIQTKSQHYSERSVCSICNGIGIALQMFVLYDNVVAAEEKNAEQRSIVHSSCIPLSAVRVSSFAFARTE